MHYEADMYFDMIGGFDPKKLKFAHSWCFSMTRVMLRQGEKVVVANTFTKKWELEPYFNLTDDYKIYRMMNDFGSIHNVPEKTIEKMRQRFEHIESETFVYFEEEPR